MRGWDHTGRPEKQLVGRVTPAREPRATPLGRLHSQDAEGAWPAGPYQEHRFSRGRPGSGSVRTPTATPLPPRSPRAVVAPQWCGLAFCSSAGTAVGPSVVSSCGHGRGVSEVRAPELGVPELRGPMPSGRFGRFGAGAGSLARSLSVSHRPFPGWPFPSS